MSETYTIDITKPGVCYCFDECEPNCTLAIYVHPYGKK